MRASKYKATSIPLANAIYQAYIVPEPAARAFAEPAANCLIEYLPDRIANSLASSIDPVSAIGSLYMIVHQCLEAEKLAVARHHAALLQRQEEPSGQDASGGREPSDGTGAVVADTLDSLRSS